MKDDEESAFSHENLLEAIGDEYRNKPPTIGVVGLSGVGKSSTINAMFSTRLKVSATVRGTNRFSSHRFDLDGKKILKKGIPGVLKVIDAPGLGEDLSRDKTYLKAYKKHLPKCDVALWIVSARNRALALDQMYFKELRKIKSLPKFVVGINQVDLIDPLDWDSYYNIPSAKQDKHLKEIIKDRREKLSDFIDSDTPVVGYSALNYYNLQSLFTACVEAVEGDRRWMFSLLKSFSRADWIAGASGLSDKEKEKMIGQEDQPDISSMLESIFQR
jgi:small GTP-binding protein